MDVTCPHCAAAYRVPDSLLKPGKKLRCAACKADWAPIAAPPEPPPAPPPPDLAPPPAMLIDMFDDRFSGHDALWMLCRDRDQAEMIARAVRACPTGAA